MPPKTKWQKLKAIKKSNHFNLLFKGCNCHKKEIQVK